MAPQTRSGADSRGQAAASGRGSLLCGRCASPVQPPLCGHAHPAVAAGRHGSDAGEKTSFPRQPRLAGLRIELSKLAGRESASRAARGERRTRKMASGAPGLGSRGEAGHRFAAGGAGLRRDSRAPRSAARTTSGAAEGPFLPGASAGQRPRDRRAALPGEGGRPLPAGVLRASHQTPEPEKPF